MLVYNLGPYWIFVLVDVALEERHVQLSYQSVSFCYGLQANVEA